MGNLNQLASNEKPKERFVSQGPNSLSNSELLAILINTGRKGFSSVELAQEVVKHSRDLKQLSNVSLHELQAIKGIGAHKAIVLKAAFELGRRMNSQSLNDKVFIKSPHDVLMYLEGRMTDLEQEHFVALFLNSKNQIIHEKTLFIGTLNASLVHPREVFKEAVKCAAHAIIVAHNHPSGDPTQSKEDIRTTKRLCECGVAIGIELLDHIIIGQQRFVSLSEEGYIDGENA